MMSDLKSYMKQGQIYMPDITYHIYLVYIILLLLFVLYWNTFFFSLYETKATISQFVMVIHAYFKQKCV